MKKYQYGIIGMATCLVISFVFLFSVIQSNQEVVETNAETVAEGTAGLSNKKIGWGVKRAQNHEQPDVGVNNKKTLDQYEDVYKRQGVK